MMIRLLEQNNFDYKKYGFPKGNYKRMKIAVIGAGAIGCLVAGYFKSRRAKR